MAIASAPPRRAGLRRAAAAAVRCALRPSRLVALLVIAAGALGGCAFTRGDLEAPFTQAQIAGIKPGQSTEAEVVRVVGAPDEIIRVGGGRVIFHYYHYAMKHATLLFFSRVNIASDQLYVFFDAQGVVERVLSGNRTGALKFQFWPFE